MSELLDKIREVQSHINVSTLEAKELLKQADGDVDLAVALYEESHPKKVEQPKPVPAQSVSSRPVNNSKDEEEPPKKLPMWVRWLALLGLVVMVGGTIGVIYLVKNHGSSSWNPFNFANKSSAEKYTRPSLDVMTAYLSDKVATSGQFDPIKDGGTSYMEVDAESYNKAIYNFSTSTGEWYIKIQNVQVRPKGYSIKISGDLIADGSIASNGAKIVDSLVVSGFTVI